MSVKKSNNENKIVPGGATGGMMLVLLFLALFVTNSLVVHFANVWFPEAVVLGTNTISRGWALLHAVGSLSLIVAFAAPFLHYYESRKAAKLSSMEWMIAYFAINVGGIWVVSRFAEQFGLGVSSWMVVVALALVLDIVQGLVVMSHQKNRVLEV